jgi:hypothetical protein
LWCFASCTTDEFFISHSIEDSFNSPPTKSAMLNISSETSTSLCDRIQRRTALQVGALGSLGLSLPSLLSQAKASGSREETSRVFGRAKRVILLFMWGGPAHQDTWDLKPEGPVESRGEFMPIETSVPGLHISEHFPLLANHADKLALIRSVGQEDNNHSTGAHAGLTGRRHELKAESFSARQTDFPHFGSVLSQLRPNQSGLPTFVSLPEVIATTNGAITPGQGGGLIGRKFDPFRISEHPDRADFSIDSLKLPEAVNLGRMQSRRNLLDAFDGAARLVDRSAKIKTIDSYYQQALDMVLAPKVRKAFDLSHVSDDERFRYGYHTFGQSVLLAKRLAESGVSLVTVYWHREKKTVDSTWDTHALNFQELKHRLMPSVDRPISALLEDLSQSGMLDDTLVVWNSEFGRTPKVNKRAGRDHWGACNTVVMAGAGVKGGQVYGASDAQAAYPIANKVTQDDIAATLYHLLGFQPESPVYDRLNRPHQIALGEPIYELLEGRCQVERTPPPVEINRPAIGEFTRMLRQRGNRHLNCEFGSESGEKEWDLTNWQAPQGQGLNRYRRIAAATPESTPAAGLKYKGMYYNHFDYSHCVFRLAEPATLEGVSLKVSGRDVAIPDELRKQPAQRVWQIRLPAGLAKSITQLSLSLIAPKWSVSDFAIVGSEIRDLHLQRAKVV